MAERFKRLFQLPANQYVEGSPIILAAGALSKDTETGSIIVQLKFQNVSAKMIKAVKVRINAFDIAGVPLQGVDEYQYLDLSVRRDDSFGQNRAIILPDGVTRSFSCTCKSVIFSDGSLWEPDNAEWSQLVTPQMLDRKLGHLVAQYKRDTSKNAKYVVTDDKGLWYCACGAINRESESVCHTCAGKKQHFLDSLDSDKLKAHYDEFNAKEAEKAAALERERAEAKSKAKAKKKKIIKTTLLMAATIIVAIAAFFLIKDIVIPVIKYSKAADLMEAGQYEEAIVAFQAMDGYKDSTGKISECNTAILDIKYDAAAALMNEGDYDGAIDAFEALGDHKDSKEQLSECKYRVAISLLEAGKYNDARELLSSLNGYGTSNGKIAVIDAIGDIEKNKFHEAIKRILFASEIIHVKYNLNGGTSSKGEAFTYSSSNNEYTSLLVPQRDGYRFVCWKLSSFSYSADNSLELVLDAVWSDAYKITYVLNGGKATNPSEYRKSGKAITLNNPTKGGYSFAGWTGTGLNGLTMTVTIPTGSYGDRQYTANWTPITYKITYNLSGGTNASGNPKSYTVESSKISLKNPTRTGYSFVGWYRDSSYKNKVTEIPSGSCGDITLYARWESSLSLSVEKISRAAVNAGGYHTVGLRSDGTVVATGRNFDGECNVSGWRDIVAISAGTYCIVGLKSNGTVVATGDNSYGQCNVSGWRNIVAISAGFGHTAGLKSDGTVVATGRNGKGQCNVSGWRNIVAISAGGYHTVGLRSDGTVVATGRNSDGQCNVSGWRDIVAISAGKFHTVGLKSDGTVVVAGDNYYGQRNVNGWRDIVAIFAGDFHTVGLKSDGTVVATGYNDDGQCNVSGWRNIVAISAGELHTVGLKSDGTVVAVGQKSFGECNVSDWSNIKLPK